MKFIYLLIGLFFSTAVFSENTFDYQGVITNQTGGGAVIYINEIQYVIDHNTIIHGADVDDGETAPLFPSGLKIGFNTNQTRISEIWVLNPL